MRASYLFALSILLSAAVSCKKDTTPESMSPTPITDAPLVPAQGALLGHYYGNGTISATDKLIGVRPQIHLIYFDWKDHWEETPIAQLFPHC